MKKFLGICFVFFGLFCLTGCGKNTLTCSKNNDYNDEIKTYQTTKVSFKKNHVNKLSINMNVKLNEEYLQFKSSLLESVISEFSGLPENAIKYSSSDTNDGFDFKVKIKYSSLNDEEKKNNAVIDYEGSYDDIRGHLEDVGYTCK